MTGRSEKPSASLGPKEQRMWEGQCSEAALPMPEPKARGRLAG